MRTITDHKLNGLNESIEISALDTPGPGGANHCYGIELIGGVKNTGHHKLQLDFQNGPIKEVGSNGFTNEALIAVVIDRLRGFQHKRIVQAGSDTPTVKLGFDFNSRGQYACRENAVALTHLEDALMWLQKRTRDRLARGVEGTNTV